jgi:hypothetical protein
VAPLVLLVLLQLTDGLFSFHGIQKIGLYNYEVNFLIIRLAEYFGIFPVIVVTKILAIFLVYVLYRKRMASLLWFLSGFYFLNLLHQIYFFIYYSG